jgi:hypothetical protein
VNLAKRGAQPYRKQANKGCPYKSLTSSPQKEQAFVIFFNKKEAIKIICKSPDNNLKCLRNHERN